MNTVVGNGVACFRKLMWRPVWRTSGVLVECNNLGFSMGDMYPLSVEVPVSRNPPGRRWGGLEEPSQARL